MDELIKVFVDTIKIDNFGQLLWTLVLILILYSVWKIGQTINQKFNRWFKLFRSKTINRIFNNNYRNIKHILLELKGKYTPDRISIIQFVNGTEYLSHLQRLNFEISHVIGEIDKNQDCNKMFNCTIYYYGFFEYFTRYIKSASDNCWELLHVANIKRNSELENLYLFNINKEYENSFNINLNYQGIKHILARGIYSNNGALISILVLEYLTSINLNDELTNIIINNNSFAIVDVNKHLTDEIMKIRKYI